MHTEGCVCFGTLVGMAVVYVIDVDRVKSWKVLLSIFVIIGDGILVSFALSFALCPWFSLFLMADSFGIHLGFGVLRSSPASTSFAAVMLPVALRATCTTQ